MIRVTRLNGEEIYLNVLQIESMETIPETKIKMMNGYYVLVKDPADSVLGQIREFIGSCFTFGKQGEQASPNSGQDFVGGKNNGFDNTNWYRIGLGPVRVGHYL